MPGVKLATAYYELIPSMGGNQAAITQQMGATGAASGKKFGKSFGAGLKGPVMAAGIAAVSAAAISFLKGSIAEAREAQKVGALTAQVIKTTGGAANVTAKQVGNLSSAISKKTGIDDEAIQSGANMLLTFTNVRNEAGKGNDIFNQATQTITDMGAALGQDAKSSAIQLGKALNDPVKGVSALSRVGVSFTDQQKEQIKAMVEAGDTAGAQKVILKELGKEFGGAAASQATAGDKMKVAWGNLQETVGTKLLPVLDKLLAGLSKVFNFIAAHQSVMIAIGVVVGVILVAALYAAATAVWAFTVALLANPVVWIIIAIIALIVGIVLLIKHWDLVKAKTIAVWNAIKSAVSKAWDAIKSWVASKIQAVRDKITQTWDTIKSKTSAAWTAVKTAITNKATEILNFVKDMPGKILDFFTSLPGKLLNVGKDLMAGLRDGIQAGFNWIRDKVGGLANLIPDWLKKVLGIASPSKVMMEIGGQVASGLAMGIERGAPGVSSSTFGLAHAAVRGVTAGSVAPASARRVNFTITNWREGTGYFDEIADARIGRQVFEAATR